MNFCMLNMLIFPLCVIALCLNVHAVSISADQGRDNVEIDKRQSNSSSESVPGESYSTIKARAATCEGDSDCKNGGTCAVEGTRKICLCPHGTNGDHCENVPSCWYLECGQEAACEYDKDKGRGACKCKDSSLYFNETQSTCTNATCTEDDDCKNHGYCDSNSCSCIDGTSGSFCENVPSCVGVDCGDDASCEYEFLIGRGVCKCKNANVFFDSSDKKCKRPEDFCEQDHPLCLPTGGKCVEENESYKCECPENSEYQKDDGCVVSVESCDKIKPNCISTQGRCKFVTGSIECECPAYMEYTQNGCEGEDPCKETECLNGGICIRDGKNFRCDCLSPYYGNKCQFGPCSSQPCKNGGRCYVVGWSYECDCVPPFKGRNCTNDICNPNPCKNDGVCVKDGNSASCICRRPYDGRFCDSVSDVVVNTGVSMIVVIVGSVFLVLLIIAIALLGHSIRLLSKKQSKGT